MTKRRTKELYGRRVSIIVNVGDEPHQESLTSIPFRQQIRLHFISVFVSGDSGIWQTYREAQA